MNFFQENKNEILIGLITGFAPTVVAVIGKYLLKIDWSDVLNYGVPTYVILILFLVVGLSYIVFSFISHIGFWNKRIGDYKFEELYQIMMSKNLPVQTQGMTWSAMPAPTDNLLFLFYRYYSYYNSGMTHDNPGPRADGNYGLGVLSPELAGYKLVEKQPYVDFEQIPGDKYVITDIGKLFYSQVEKLIQKNQKKMNASPISNP